MAAAAVANGFAPNSVILGRECEGHEGSSVEFGGRAMERVEAAMADPDADVLDAEEVIGCGTWKTTVLARSKKEEVREDQAIARRREANVRGAR